MSSLHKMWCRFCICVETRGIVVKSMIGELIIISLRFIINMWFDLTHREFKKPRYISILRVHFVPSFAIKESYMHSNKKHRKVISFSMHIHLGMLPLVSDSTCFLSKDSTCSLFGFHCSAIKLYYQSSVPQEQPKKREQH